MANVLTRRLLNKNVLKVKNVTCLAVSTCPNILFTQYDGRNRYFCVKHQFRKTLPPLSKTFCDLNLKYYSTDSKEDKAESKSKDVEKKEEKLTIFKKFKHMYRNYWYVLVPVHLVTSAAWFGGFYYMAKSGIDIVALLESWHVSEKLTNPLKDSKAGYIALSYALFKIATPARYTVTLGGTTVSINYLKKWGYIKPVPSKERMKEIYHLRKENLLESLHEKKEGMKERKDQIVESVKERKDKLKERKTGIKKAASIKDKPED